MPLMLKDATCVAKSDKTFARGNWREWLAPGAIVALALALRFYRLDAQSLWYDEGWSVHLAQGSLGQLLAQASSDGHTHPPGYYILLLLWTRLFGGSVFAVRSLSVVIGAATVWATYRLGRELFDRVAGLAAATLLALAPAHAVYSQEARMYVLLGLCYAVVLRLFYRYALRREAWMRRDWLLLVVAEIAAVYAHYFAFMALASLAIWMLACLIVQAGRNGLRPLWQWLASQAIVAVAFAPWMGVAVQRAATHTALDATAFAFWPFVAQTWSFLAGGHIALYGREPHYALAAGIYLGTALALWVCSLLIRKRLERQAVVYLLMQSVLPLAMIYLLMQTRLGFHPRYVLMLLIPLLALLGQGIVVLWRSNWIGRIGASAVLLAWGTVAVLAARAYWVDPYYARDEARATVAYLRSSLSPDAVVLVDNDDWALRYYLQGHGRQVYYLTDDQISPEVISPLLEGATQAALVKWYQGESDKNGLLPYLLERAGAHIETRDLPGYSVQWYRLDGVPAALHSRAVNVNIGPLRLLDATVEIVASADEAITVALTWRKEAENAPDLKMKLMLVDELGRTVADGEQRMRDRSGAGVDAWQIGQTVTDYATLPLGAGIAPLRYTLRLSVYHEGDLGGYDVLDAAGAPAGKSYDLAEVELTPARGLAHKMVDHQALGLKTLADALVAPGLELCAFAPSQDKLQTGDTLSVLLEWRNAEDQLPDYLPSLRLVRQGQVLAWAEAAPVYGRYSTALWQPGEVVLEWRDMVIPPDIASGPAEVEIAVWGESSVSLGAIEIEAVERLYQAPDRQVKVVLSIGDFAELVGYDLPDAILASQDIPLILYWRVVGQTDKDYVVFIHLLDNEGRLVAQHDSPPASGDRATTSWVRDEYIVDAHALHWVEAGYRGPASIEVGLYDPLSGQRVLTPQGDSRLLLPSSIIVR